MKRHPALTSLSHDHHQALFVAQKLRRAAEDDVADARQAFLDFWREHGREHFRIEEEVLLPAFAGHGDAHHPLVARMLCEHVAIRHRAGCLEGGAATAQELHELGTELDAHVRLEERRVFPLIEEAIPEPELSALAASLEEAEG